MARKFSPIKGIHARSETFLLRFVKSDKYQRKKSWKKVIRENLKTDEEKERMETHFGISLVK